MFGLVDGNNFYASCERVFQPALRGKPLVVLSNNDGCAIARSAEAKALGIKMGQPAHELKHPVRHHGLQLRSANFGLYADLSGRVVSVLRDAAPRVEVYSIDESFIDLERVRNRERFARELRARVHRWTGIPNCIGIGPTRGLVATGLWVFVHSDSFRPELPQHNATRSVVLPAATSDTALVLGTIRKLLRCLLKDGIGYKKAGVALLDLPKPQDLQADLFSPAIAGNDALMATLDQINRKFGRGVAGLGASGWKDNPVWGMRQHMLSPNYTRSFDELTRVRC